MFKGSEKIFGRACGAGSKSNFSDLLFKAQYVPNKSFFFATPQKPAPNQR